MHRLPRHRLDAGAVVIFFFRLFKKIFIIKTKGTFGTMGVGSGFAIASSLYCQDYHPDKKVVCIQGDSAFGRYCAFTKKKVK